MGEYNNNKLRVLRRRLVRSANDNNKNNCPPSSGHFYACGQAKKSDRSTVAKEEEFCGHERMRHKAKHGPEFRWINHTAINHCL